MHVIIMKPKLLGITKVSTDNKITLIETVVKKLKTSKGDRIVFYEESGRVYIDKA